MYIGLVRDIQMETTLILFFLSLSWGYRHNIPVLEKTYVIKPKNCLE